MNLTLCIEHLYAKDTGSTAQHRRAWVADPPGIVADWQLGLDSCDGQAPQQSTKPPILVQRKSKFKIQSTVSTEWLLQLHHHGQKRFKSNSLNWGPRVFGNRGEIHHGIL